MVLLEAIEQLKTKPDFAAFIVSNWLCFKGIKHLKTKPKDSRFARILWLEIFIAHINHCMFLKLITNFMLAVKCFIKISLSVKHSKFLCVLSILDFLCVEVSDFHYRALCIWDNGSTLCVGF